MFSPSGHRLYVAQEDDKLMVLDRFSGDQLDAIDLPGPAKGLRGDRFGQWLLVQPAAGDSAWVIDIGRGRLSGAVAARWSGDLPAVASPNTLLVRRGKDVVALDLGHQGVPGGRPGRRTAPPTTGCPSPGARRRDAEADVTADSTARRAAADSGTGRARRSTSR